ncbi:MAG TPA: DUF5908 family protein [Allosphingosinicella sp.]|jgi:hypothetical protein
MPLEVRQIGIRMAVGGTGAASNSGGENNSALDLLKHEGDDAGERNRMIQECVEAVLAELARRQGR